MKAQKGKNMTELTHFSSRNLVLFVGSYLDSQYDALKEYEVRFGTALKPLVVVDVTERDRSVFNKDLKVKVLEVDFTSDAAIAKALAPYKDEILTVNCRAERNIPLLRKILPHVPFHNGPTQKSLKWTTDKILMRQMLRAYDKDISPNFMVVNEVDELIIDSIERKIGYPLILKPSGLAASLLVSVCYHREELEENLRRALSRMHKIYKKKRGRGEPQVLVEQLMEGVMYSLDSYVNDKGVIYHTHLVHVRTGRSVGFDDFFGYQRVTPVRLKKHKVEDAKEATEKAIKALNLRSTTTHTELMKTEDGWKIIELGPRIGGFRHEMYKLSYGINHSLNDMLVKIPKKPIINKKVRGYTSVMQFYAKKEGRLESVIGLKKARQLESFVRIKLKKKPGDLCQFASNGDDPVFDIVLFNRSRSRLLADVRRLEKNTKINIKPRKKPSGSAQGL